MPLVSDPTFGTGTQLVIDPSEVAVDRTEFPINEGDVRVAEGGPDWNQSAIVAAMAEAARGELPVDFRIPNRQITIPLLLGGTPGGADFDTQRRYLQAKVGLIQREGGWLKRQDPDKDPVYFDLVNASLTLPDQYGHLSVEANVVLTLDAIPDFYGDEVELTDHSETTLPELVFTETDIEGDYPGRLRLVVDNDSAADQLGLVACVRSRHYDAAATARLAYEAEALTPLDTASVATLVGASGGATNNAVTHDDLATSWTPVLSTNLLAGDFLTHKGSYRVRARVSTTSGVSTGRPPSLRFVWDVGDLAFPEENDPWAIPRGTNVLFGEDPVFFIADLGEIRLDPVPVGAHRWQGQIQARGNFVSTMDVSIDRVWFEPLDEGHAVLTAPAPSISASLAPVARDSFDQTAGALNGKTANVGGNWATAGDTDDFTIDATGHTATRNSASDSGGGAMPGRFAVLGPALTAQAPQVDYVLLSEDNALTPGVVARYVDTDNYVIATIDARTGILTVTVVVGGSPEVISTEVVGATIQYYTYALRMAVGPSGAVTVWLGQNTTQGVSPTTLAAVARGQHSALATGGALASGKPGYYDANPTAFHVVRIYDNFLVTVPTFDAVAFANQSVQLGSDGNFREDSSGAAYGPVSIDSGDLLRVPPSGIEGRTVEFMVKASRGDLGELPDAAIDDVSVRAWYRPSWLTMPW